MERQDPKRHPESPGTSIDIGRRRVIAGMGTLAAASWLPIGARAQDTVSETETVIIGGGMAGCATALQLARHGRDVTLLERGQIASEASGQNMGGCGGAGWGNKPNLLSYLTAGSMEIFKELQLDLGYDMEFRQAGSMTGIRTDEEYEYVQKQGRDPAGGWL